MKYISRSYLYPHVHAAFFTTLKTRLQPNFPFKNFMDNENYTYMHNGDRKFHKEKKF